VERSEAFALAEAQGRTNLMVVDALAIRLFRLTCSASLNQ
jgi:hypothetical protein